MTKLDANFYRRANVVEVARDLLGKVLCSRIDGKLCRLMITETEAYAGETDKASHAYGGRRTARTEPIYAAGGCAYIYLCYGIHHLFNVVTSVTGVPHAVLVRAGEPLTGVDTMLARRKRQRADKGLLPGPGTVAQALGISTALTGDSLQGPLLWIEHNTAEGSIIAGPRIGVDYAEEDAALPYRFRLLQDE